MLTKIPKLEVKVLNESKYSMPWVRCAFDNVSGGKLTWLVSVRWLQPQGQVDLNSSSSVKEKMKYKHKILNTF